MEKSTQFVIDLLNKRIEKANKEFDDAMEKYKASKNSRHATIAHNIMSQQTSIIGIAQGIIQLLEDEDPIIAKELNL